MTPQANLTGLSRRRIQFNPGSAALSIAVGTVIADRPPQSSRIVARTGLRMMPTFPRSPLSFRTAGFPQYGWKVCMSDGTFLGASRLSSLPAYATSTSSLSPSFVSADQLLNSSSESGNRGHTDTAKSGRGQPAPQGSSLPVWVILSQSIIT